jgi:NAD(P)-dependent dehydrogenase (short-subunit alcohol dehydrogenase family)
MAELAGKTVLITGAAKGIGRAAAQAAIDQGATVIGADIDEALLAKAAGETGLDPLALDVTSADMWRAAVASVRARHGRLDTLVNNAGVILNRPFLQTSLEDFRRVQTINVESVWLGMQTCFPLLAETGKDTDGSSIVNLSSIYGIVAGAMHSAYAASKGAVRMLTKAAAIEFATAQARVRVNSVHPGPVNTDLGTSGLREAVAAGRIKSFEDGVALRDARQPMGRIAEVDDIVGAIVFLASDRSRFMSGAEMVIDGAYTAR